jgi:hypothetical protein
MQAFYLGSKGISFLQKFCHRSGLVIVEYSKSSVINTFVDYPKVEFINHDNGYPLVEISSENWSKKFKLVSVHKKTNDSILVHGLIDNNPLSFEIIKK